MLKVTGSSDDLIELEGDIYEEFSRYNSSGDYLAFSDGTVLKAFYTNDGIWRFNLVVKGSLYKNKIDGIALDDTFDEVYFDDGIKWCVIGPDFTTSEK